MRVGRTPPHMPTAMGRSPAERPQCDHPHLDSTVARVEKPKGIPGYRTDVHLFGAFRGACPTAAGRVFRPRGLNSSSVAAAAIRVLAWDEPMGFTSSAIASRPSVLSRQSCRLLAGLNLVDRFGRPAITRSRLLPARRYV